MLNSPPTNLPLEGPPPTLPPSFDMSRYWHDRIQYQLIQQHARPDSPGWRPYGFDTHMYRSDPPSNSLETVSSSSQRSNARDHLPRDSTSQLSDAPDHLPPDPTSTRKFGFRRVLRATCTFLLFATLALAILTSLLVMLLLPKEDVRAIELLHFIPPRPADRPALDRIAAQLPNQWSNWIRDPPLFDPRISGSASHFYNFFASYGWSSGLSADWVKFERSLEELYELLRMQKSLDRDIERGSLHQIERDSLHQLNAALDAALGVTDFLYADDRYDFDDDEDSSYMRRNSADSSTPGWLAESEVLWSTFGCPTDDTLASTPSTLGSKLGRLLAFLVHTLTASDEVEIVRIVSRMKDLLSLKRTKMLHSLILIKTLVETARSQILPKIANEAYTLLSAPAIDGRVAVGRLDVLRETHSLVTFHDLLLTSLEPAILERLRLIDSLDGTVTDMQSYISGRRGRKPLSCEEVHRQCGSEPPRIIEDNISTASHTIFSIESVRSLQALTCKASDAFSTWKAEYDIIDRAHLPLMKDAACNWMLTRVLHVATADHHRRLWLQGRVNGNLKQTVCQRADVWEVNVTSPMLEPFPPGVKDHSPIKSYRAYGVARDVAQALVAYLPSLNRAQGPDGKSVSADELRERYMQHWSSKSGPWHWMVDPITCSLTPFRDGDEAELRMTSVLLTQRGQCKAVSY